MNRFNLENGRENEKRKKMSHLEKILLRPEKYIGSVESVQKYMWVFDDVAGRMVYRMISYVPGLYTIFDDILVNAANKKQRDHSMNTIKIDIDQEKNLISVWNNGQGVPITMNKKKKMFLPTMIFGQLMNCNYKEMEVAGGRNGFGAKLCNIFSTKFVVETATKDSKHTFKQTWSKNMSKAFEPKIKDFSGTDFTKITFSPDLNKFKLKCLDDDIVALMSRRAYDVAGCAKGVTVFLNGKQLAIKNFKDYIDLYIEGEDEIIYDQKDNWEVACCKSKGDFNQVSFVNCIATTDGGKHVDHIVDNILKQSLVTADKTFIMKPADVRNYLWVFVNCFIENPTFESQTKEKMNLSAKSFGSKWLLSETFIGQFSESILASAKAQLESSIRFRKGMLMELITQIDRLTEQQRVLRELTQGILVAKTDQEMVKELTIRGYSRETIKLFENSI